MYVCKCRHMQAFVDAAFGEVGISTTMLRTDYLSFFQQVFTTQSYDHHKNYEFFEFMGDKTYNKIIGTILSRLVPQFCTSKTQRKLAILSDFYRSNIQQSRFVETMDFAHMIHRRSALTGKCKSMY